MNVSPNVACVNCVIRDTHGSRVVEDFILILLIDDFAGRSHELGGGGLHERLQERLQMACER